MNTEDAARLLSKGFYRKNLPKPFSSQSFGDNYAYVASLVERHQHNIPYRYDTYKKKYATRRFTILNPYNYAKLVKTFEDNWTTIEATLNSSRHSYTPIVFGEDGESGILQMSKVEFQDLVFENTAGMTVLVSTDITEHYDSTYTHSIAWAMHDKDFIKEKLQEVHKLSGAKRAAAKRNYDNLPGNLIDRVVRDGDEQQTNGIPTGPETSRIISEIILSAVDSELSSELKEKKISYVGGRYVDDYELYFKTERDASRGLQILRDILSKYKLRISEQKTKILSGPPIPLEDEWERRLRLITPQQLYKSEEAYSVTSEELEFRYVRTFIKEAVSLTRELENHKVIYRTLRYLRNYECNNETKNLYRVYILQLLANYPNTAKPAFDILMHHGFVGDSEVEKLLNRMLSYKNTTVYDLIWFTYGVIIFETKLTPLATENLMSRNDPILYLILLHLGSLGLADIDKVVIAEKWKKYTLHDEGWLFKYEAVRHGWLEDDGTIEADNFFLHLSLVEIGFYITDGEAYEFTEDDWVDDYELASGDWFNADSIAIDEIF